MIVHVITNLGTGGAEEMLYRLLTRVDHREFASHVISLRNIGCVGRKIAGLGIPVDALGMRRGVPDVIGMLRLAQMLRRERPQVVQTWMYHADLVGGVAAKLAGGIPVAWGIHNTALQPGITKRSTLWSARLCAQLSHVLPARIVCCAEAARTAHSAQGYDFAKMLVIPNGFDLAAFRPNPEARLSVRQELGLGAGARLIGLVARFNPVKDHRTFLRAARLLREQAPDVHFLLCGEEVTPSNTRLMAWLAEDGLVDCCHLLGQRTDIPRIQASLDIASLSSVGEGLPLVIGEAMACGVPCVVTDVGDAGLIVGGTGRVVPAGDPAALAAGWRALLDMGVSGRNHLGQLARHRIATHFELSVTAARYAALYEELAAGATVRRRSNVTRCDARLD